MSSPRKYASPRSGARPLNRAAPTAPRERLPPTALLGVESGRATGGGISAARRRAGSALSASQPPRGEVGTEAPTEEAAALQAAENEPEGSDKLQSAGDDGSAGGAAVSLKEAQRRSAGRTLAKLAVCAVAMALVGAAHVSESWLVRSALGVSGGLAFALIGWRRKSLNVSGAVGAAIVGAVTLVCSFRCTFVLLAFFFASSAITTIGEELKDIDENHKKGGQRDIVQVLCNGGVPTALAVVLLLATNGVDLPVAASKAAAALSAAFMGYYACCAGDTWASELGILSKQQPRLITTLEPVRRGTNGGVTMLGFGASLAGGLFVGLCFYVAGVLSPGKAAAARPEFIAEAWVVLLGGAAGLLGSLIDSVLGATVQFTGYNLDTQKITGKAGDRVKRISGQLPRTQLAWSQPSRLPHANPPLPPLASEKRNL